jgi:hypothetical protein
MAFWSDAGSSPVSFRLELCSELAPQVRGKHQRCPFSVFCIPHEHPAVRTGGHFHEVPAL